MMRLLIVMVISLALSACSGSNNSNAPNAATAENINNPQNTTQSGISADLDPTLITLDTPPTNGQLPNDLIPPL